MTVTRFLIAVLLGASLLAACGKKGNPIRPTSDAPQDQTEEN
ncbi:MAG: hypothetical protein AAFV19_18040 [Pseudomonadota bacterium]